MRICINELREKVGFGEVPRRTKLAVGVVMLISVVTAVIVTINFALIKYEWLNVHLVPHTHDDVGWVKTPEEYYQHYVKFILSHVVLELQKNPTRKFVYAETYFFWKWWQEQSNTMKELVRWLIEKKQLEIVGGGWCMSDEAVTHYQSFIDQSTWGFRRLNDTFGPMASPSVGWQIDTFGHSKGIASLLAQMGFNSLFFARIDLNERKYRKAHKLLEFVWTGNKNLGDSGSIFTSVFYDHYSAPNGFDFEMQATQTDVDYGAFSNYVRKHAKAFKTDNILVPMGDDFRYFNAKKYFHKMDMLIRFFEENPVFKLRVFYSTPSRYIENLRNCDLSWPVKQGDFFPYASEYHSYWTGFYTSRPTLKYFGRISNNILQIAKQLLVFSGLGMQFFDELTSLREAVGVLQHHDAITGTAQQHVTNHYSELLHQGIVNCNVPLDYSLRTLSLRNDFKGPIYKSCLLLNISSCDITESSSRFVVTVYNPLSRNVDHYVRVPVTGMCYTVLTAKGEQQRTQMTLLPKSVTSIPGRLSSAYAELVFRASKIPAMGFKSFYVAEIPPIKCSNSGRKRKRGFFKKKFRAIFNHSNKLLTGIKTKRGNISLVQSMKYYKSTPHLSGAYLFTPKDDKAHSFEGEVTTRLINNGLLVKEYEQRFSTWASQIIRLYAEEDYIEFEWLVGPIPINDCIGKEVIMLYNTTIRNGKVFYTDVNGMEMEKRVKDYQSWRDKVYESVSGNYYPVTTTIAVKDDFNQMYVVIDRPQGGSSLENGEIQLMVHRRLCYDDGKGVEEPLNETAYGMGLVVRGRHWIMFGERKLQFDQKVKLFSQTRHSEPWLFFFDASTISFDEWRNNYVTEFSGLHSYVPRNVRILTLEPWRENTVLIRFEHIFEKLPALRLANAPEDINLKDLFKSFDVIEARETTLGADRWLSDWNRPKWRKHVYNLKENKERQHLDFQLTFRRLGSRTCLDRSALHTNASAVETKNVSRSRQGFETDEIDPKLTPQSFQSKAKSSISNRLEDCVYCGKTLPHKLLIKHKAEEEKYLKCQYCDKTFENVHLFRRHTYRYHKYYSCKVCSLKFLKGAYEYHMSSVHRGKQECKICSKTFATKLSLVAHEKKIHLGQREERFQCQVCKYRAPDKFQYKVHLARHNKAPSLVCDYCGAGHYTKTELKKHIQADHCGGYPCDICSKSFRSSEYLKRHKMTHDPDYDPSKINFACEECGKGFLNEARFKRHSLRHKGQVQMFNCNLCGKGLTSKASYETHIRMHSGTKPFTCHECGKAFSDKKYLAEHKRHHDSNRTFTCHICGEKFFLYGLLVDHKKIHDQSAV